MHAAVGFICDSVQGYSHSSRTEGCEYEILVGFLLVAVYGIWYIDALALKPAIYIEPSPNVKTEKWSNFNVDLIGVPVVSEAPNFA